MTALAIIFVQSEFQQMYRRKEWQALASAAQSLMCVAQTAAAAHDIEGCVDILNLAQKYAFSTCTEHATTASTGPQDDKTVYQRTSEHIDVQQIQCCGHQPWSNDPTQLLHGDAGPHGTGFAPAGCRRAPRGGVRCGCRGRRSLRHEVRSL